MNIKNHGDVAINKQTILLTMVLEKFLRQYTYFLNYENSHKHNIIHIMFIKIIFLTI